MNFALVEPDRFADYAYINRVNDGRDAFTDEECDLLIELADQLPSRSGTTAAEGNFTPEIRNVAVVDITASTARFFYEKLLGLAASVNAYWWNFDIRTLSNIEVLRYLPGGHYEEHIDRFGSFQTRKLTSVTFLNDDYEGGDLLLRTTEGIISAPKEEGTTVFFPSWVPHQVTPVTAGERRVASAWFQGPPFR